MDVAVFNEVIKQFSNKAEYRSHRALHGGDINDAYRLETSKGAYFVKFNYAEQYPHMFEKEARGLQLLASTKTLRIPEVVCAGEFLNVSFLVLEMVEKGSSKPNFWEDFGQQLAALHQNTSEQFGLKEYNYIGSLPQDNEQEDDWNTFFTEKRIMHMALLAGGQGYYANDELIQFEQFCEKMETIIPKEPPALLHGDLWSGNYMVADHGLACIYDPAVYYGHREIDLGMTKLFGGFDQRMYDAYNEAYPLEKGWEERIDIMQLYPLLVHVNLFGGGYRDSALSIVRKYL